MHIHKIPLRWSISYTELPSYLVDLYKIFLITVYIASCIASIYEIKFDKTVFILKLYVWVGSAFYDEGKF